MKKLIATLQEKHDAFIGNRENEVTSAKAEGFRQGLEWAIETAKTLTGIARAEKEYNKQQKTIKLCPNCKQEWNGFECYHCGFDPGGFAPNWD